MSGLQNSTRAWLVGVLTGLPLVVGCSEDIKGPTPVLDPPSVGASPPPVAPGILCRDQRVTDVVLSGEGFSPLPFDLAHDPRTMLPDVTLRRASALDGGAGDGAEVLYSGHPEVTTNVSLLSWQSQEQMTMRVLPSCGPGNACPSGLVCHASGVCAASVDVDVTGPLAEGIYDVRVDNPNGSTTTSAGSLAAIGKPTLASLTPPIVCLAQGARTVTLAGTRFLTIEDDEAVVAIEGVATPWAVDAGTFTGCTNIPHAGYATLRYCTGGTITLAQDSVAVGYPAVTVQNPETAACESEDAVNLRVVPPPTITAIAAIEEAQGEVASGDGTIVCLAEGPRDIVIHGTDFLGIDLGDGELVPAVTVDDAAVTVTGLGGCEDLPTMGITVRRCSTVTVTLPTSMAAGEDPYQPVVRVTNPDPAGCTDATSDARKNFLTIAPPPDVVSVEPPIVCLDDGDRTVVVHGTDFLLIDGTPPAVTFGAVAMDAADVVGQACVALDVAGKTVERCEELAVTIPEASLDLGQPDVTVDNPMPAGCSDTEEEILTVVAGPEIEAAAPPLVCTADGARTVTIEGTGFLTIDGAPPTVTMDGVAYTVGDVGGCTAVPVDGLVVESCQSLAVALPQGSLAPGDTVVTVTNGPGDQGCTVSDSVVLTVPPVVSVVEVDPGAVCISYQDTLSLRITGSGFLRVDATDFTLTIGGVATTPTAIEDCTALTVDGHTVQSCNTIVASYDTTGRAVGPVPITVTNPAPSGCGATAAAAFNIAPPPTLTNIAPDEVCEDDVDTFVLTGTGFVPTTVVRANDVAATAITFVSATELRATFADGLPAGLYDITLDNGEGCTSTVQAALTVHPMPLVFFVDPPVVYNDIVTEATIYASNLDATPAAVQLIAEDDTVIDITTFSTPVRPGRIQAQIPAGIAPGVYEVSVTSVYDCQSTLNGILTVTDETTLSVAIEPAFASPTQPTAITVTEDADGFVPVPRVYLNPVGGGIAAPARAVVLEGPGTLSGVVPGGLAPGLYDVIVVNPTGEVAVLEGGLTVTAAEPPIVTSVAPGSFDANTSDQEATIVGEHFGTDPLTIDVALECVDFETGAAAPTNGTVTVNTASATALEVDVDTTGMSAGLVCLVIVTNPDGASYRFSAVSLKEPSQNLNPWLGTADGTPSMTEARRALALAAGRPTDRSRFLYAIGGDAGTTATAKTSIESVPVSVYGTLGAWTAQRNDLSQVWVPNLGMAMSLPRTFAQVARVGRFLYLTGGHDGTNSVATVLRAQIMNPLDGPEVLDLDAALGDGTIGLDKGIYYYRVAATFPTSDPSNPGGESLPGEIFTVQLPEVADKLVLTLTWQAVPGADGYRLYRTPRPDASPADLQLIFEATGGGATTYIDDGGDATDPSETPFPQGSLGVWHTVSALGTARHAHASVSVRDPADPSRWFLYSAGGRSGTTALASVEVAIVTTSGAGQTLGAWTTTASLGAARAELGGLAIGPADTDVITNPTDVWLFFTQGRATSLVDRFEYGKVGVDGAVTSFTQLGGPSPTRAGAVDLAANGWIFLFGGSNGGASNGNDTSSELLTATPADMQWDSLGGGGMTMARLFADGVKESAFFFIAGGTSGTGALSNVEQTIQ
ncbi:MAG: hypothetical protein IT385_15670 [Deltaproteobacteria bacterium]|nr:hypothetical protein [Deltaproteobacteria bacterium]